MSSDKKLDRSKIQKIIHNDRGGYSIIFYETNKDHWPCKEPEVILHKENGIGELKAAGKPVSSLSDDLRKPNNKSEDAVRKAVTHQKIVEIQDTFSNIKNMYKKAENQDLQRRKIINPSVRRSLRGRSADEICDILLKDVMKNNDFVFNSVQDEKCSKETRNALRKRFCSKKTCETVSEKPKACEIKKSCEEVKKVCQGCCCSCSCKKEEQPKKCEEQPKTEECQRSSKCLIVPNLQVLKPVDSSHTKHLRHLEAMRQREYEIDIFEKSTTAMLRRLRNDIRELELKYL
jgi:hypothetical protein